MYLAISPHYVPRLCHSQGNANERQRSAPKLAVSFDTAGLYFFYAPLASFSPSNDAFGAGAVQCDAATYGSLAVKTALAGPRPDLWICTFTNLGANYDWQEI